MAVSITDSQNFSLRISDSFNVDDTQESTNIKEAAINNENSIIVISDSSTDSSPRCSGKRKVDQVTLTNRSACNKNQIKQKPYVSETSDSESLSSDDSDIPVFQKLRKNKKHVIKTHTLKEHNNLQTPDSTLSGNTGIQDLRNKSDSSDSTHVSPTPKLNSYILELSNTNKNTNIYEKRADYISSSSSSSQKNSYSDLKRTTTLISQKGSSKKPISLKKTLTKEDAHNIFKNIKSTKLVYESPLRKKENNIIINESIDDEIHPAIENHNYLKIKGNENMKIVNETDSDISSDDRDEENSQKVLGTCTDKLLMKANENTDPGLSARKKKEICQWIMSNTADSKDDSSLSYVPPSNRSSMSSGNSSLERLEMNYETPNNRGKISKSHTSEKTLTKTRSIEKTHNSTLRQATMHRFLQNSTRKDSQETPDKVPKKQLTSSVQTPQDINILHCADILDKLYGNTWRTKADVLLPSSEPRKNNVMTKDRAIQTEKKKTYRNIVSSVDSEEETFNTFVKNMKPKLNSTKRQQKEKRSVPDSFIDDESMSDESDSIYHTALTNIRNSDVSSQPKPASAITKKIIEICDSDSENEPFKNYANQEKNFGRRKLLFSDDDDGDSKGSSTSEFDPGDEVPPKPLTGEKKNNGKEHLSTPRGLSTNNFKPAPAIGGARVEKHKSFLASLSHTVPVKEAHPDARKYRSDFKNTKEELCKKLFKLYNEKIFDNKLPFDMSIEWNIRMRGSAGFCYNKRSLKTLSGMTKSSRIVLATKILDTPDRLRDTLVHEMCHAAAWLINDVSDGHGPYWKGWASKAMKTFPELPPIRRCHDYQIKTKFTYKCTGCGYSIGRHSKSLDTERKRCGHCYGKFELLINKTTKSGTVQVQTPKRELNGFALFVKENYSTVKRDRNAKHAEIMKILGQQFSAIKIVKKRTDDIDNNRQSPI